MFSDDFTARSAKPFVRIAAFASVAFAFVGGTMAPLAAQTPPPVAGTATAQPASKDYMIKVGKHYMWKSQLAVMHPELAQKAQPLSKTAGNDYLVQVGKTPVLASTLRRVAGPNTTRPAPHDKACKDYLVQSGKRAVWASSIGAPCPAGPHKGEQKPLCCVVAVETEKKLMPCCRSAQGKMALMP